ncbi:MAG: hypothetical protein ACE5HN_06800 [Nitrospiria bacterium]
MSEGPVSVEKMIIVENWIRTFGRALAQRGLYSTAHPTVYRRLEAGDKGLAALSSAGHTEQGLIGNILWKFGLWGR